SGRAAAGFAMSATGRRFGIVWGTLSNGRRLPKLYQGRRPNLVGRKYWCRQDLWRRPRRAGAQLGAIGLAEGAGPSGRPGRRRREPASTLVASIEPSARWLPSAMIA